MPHTPHTLCYGLLCATETQHVRNWVLKSAWKCSLWEQGDSDLSAETLTEHRAVGITRAAQ